MAVRCLVSFVCVVFCLSSTAADDRSAAVVAYLPEWRFNAVNWAAVSAHVSHLILFSAEVGPRGTLTALERLPSGAALDETRAATREAGTALLLCIGGNGRSDGFGPMVRDKGARTRFIAALLKWLLARGFDGVDYNWEYPGYAMGVGYKSEGTVHEEYVGLARLVKETKAAFASSARPRMLVTLAYYPDGRQEALLVQHGAANASDMVHAMAYDAGQGHHSPVTLAATAISGAAAARLPSDRLTIGLPFYGRAAGTGEWKTYEEIVRDWPDAVQDDVAGSGGARWSFNGPATITRKTEMALDAGARGVMIWEVGQDCRLGEVARHGQVHAATCAGDPERYSLLHAISRGLRARGARLERYWQDGGERDVAGAGGGGGGGGGAGGFRQTPGDAAGEL